MKGYKNKAKSKSFRERVNEEIRSKKVLCIDSNNNNIGVVETKDALALAYKENLDLVQNSFSNEWNVPACKILDYGKFQYQQGRSQQKTKKTETKGVRLSFKIGEHDMAVKEKQVNKFLEQGHKVKVELRLRGRERAFRNKAKEVIQTFLDKLTIQYKQEKPIEIQGPTLSVIISKN